MRSLVTTLGLLLLCQLTAATDSPNDDSTHRAVTLTGSQSARPSSSNQPLQPMSPASSFHVNAAEEGTNLLDAIKDSSWTRQLRAEMKRGLRSIGAAAAPSVLRLIAKLPPKQQQQAWRVILPLAMRMHAFDAASAGSMEASMCAPWEISQDSNSGRWLSDEPPWRRRFRRARRRRIRRPSNHWPQESCDWWPPFRCNGRESTATEVSQEYQLASHRPELSLRRS